MENDDDDVDNGVHKTIYSNIGIGIKCPAR